MPARPQEQPLHVIFKLLLFTILTPYDLDEIPLVQEGRESGVWAAIQASRVLTFQIAKAIDSMVIDHADGLHKGVNNCWPDEAEAASLERFAHGL